MPAIETTIRIERSPEEVWAVLGDLARVTDWVPGIASAHVEGMTRICTLADGGGEIHEEITDFSDERRAYSYTQPVHPLGFRSSRGTLAVEPAGAASRLVWNAEVEFADRAQEDQLLGVLEQGYRAAAERLKATVEAAP